MKREVVNTPARPLVTVIIPAHNYGHFIAQTLDGVRAQTYHNWECVVVDDGSTDATKEVVGRYAEGDARIRYIYQKNQGPSASRNRGILNSGGKYLQFLDADDSIEPEKLAKQVAYLERHAEADIVYGSVRFFSTDNVNERLVSMWGENKPWMPEVSGKGQKILLELVKANIMVVNAPLIRRSAVDAVGLFDRALKGVEDWDYWIRCAARGLSFHYQDLEGTLALVRSHASSVSKDRRQMYSKGLLLRKKINKSVSDAEAVKLNRRIGEEQAAALGLSEVTNGNIIRGVTQLVEAGLMSDRRNPKMKWFLCAFIAPFVTERFLKKAVSFSVVRCASDVTRKFKSSSS